MREAASGAPRREAQPRVIPIGEQWINTFRSMGRDFRDLARQGQWPPTVSPEVRQFYTGTFPIQRMIGADSGDWPTPPLSLTVRDRLAKYQNGRGREAMIDRILQSGVEDPEINRITLSTYSPHRLEDVYIDKVLPHFGLEH